MRETMRRPYSNNIKLTEKFINEGLESYIKREYGNDYYIFYKTMKLPKGLDEKLKDNKKKLEGRTKEEFLINLILAWIIEDEVIELYQSYLDKKRGIGKVRVEATGCDKNRALIFRNKVTNECDIVVRDLETNEIIIKIELKSNFSGFITNYKAVDLRQEGGQLNILKKEAEKYRVYVMALDLKNLSFSFIEINENVEYKAERNPLWKKTVDRLRVSKLNPLSCLR